MFTNNANLEHFFPFDFILSLQCAYVSIAIVIRSLFSLVLYQCKTSQGNELTRISLVDESLDVVYDTLVKPPRPVVDYLTQ